MSGYIPKEQLAAYKRWEMDDFATPRPRARQPAQATPLQAAPAEPVAPPVPNPALPTAEELEGIYNEAQQAGHDAGYAAGQEAGYQAGLQAAQEQIERLAALADNFRNSLHDLEQTAADQLLQLSLEVARQVIRSELRQHPENLAAVVREGLAALPLNHSAVSLHLNPADAALTAEHLGELFTQSGWRIIEDPAVTQGGCRLNAGTSEVDATLETRWRRVLESLGAPNLPPPEMP